MQADWLSEHGAKVLDQPGTAGFLVATVEAPVGKVFVLALK
jgi:hypothetical protein